MGKMRVMNPAMGDDYVKWSPRNKRETARAKRLFEEKIASGWRAYRVEGRRGEQIEEFDPEAGELLLSMPMAGGGDA